MSNAFAADRYWVGGGSSANWSATGPTNWGSASNTQDNASVPTSSDDVYFDGVGTGASDSTLSASITIRSLNMTGYANTLTHNSSVTLSIGDATAGAGNIALKLVAGMTYTLGSATTSAISFITTSATQQTVTWGGKTAGNVTFNATSNGDWAITDAMTTGATATVTLTMGTLHTDGTADNSGLSHSWGLFVNNSGSTRTLTLGTSNITITGASTTVWNQSNATGLTFSGASSTITMTGTSALFGARSFSWGTVNFNGGGTMGFSASGNPSFVNLAVNGTAAKTDNFTLIGTTTVTGTLTLAGQSATNRLLVKSTTLGTALQFTNTGATMTWSNVDFRDITLSDAYDASSITGLSGDCGGNTNITFTTGTTVYYYRNTGSWSDSSVWFLATNGGGGAGRVPLPQDNATFDANSFNASGHTVTVDMPRIGRTITLYGHATYNPTYTFSVANTVYGSFTVPNSTLTITRNNTLTFEGRGAFTMTPRGLGALTGQGNVTVAMVGGSLTLQAQLSIGGTIAVTNGSLIVNGYGLYSTTLTTSAGTTLDLSAGTASIYINGLTGTALSLSASTTFSAGNSTFYLTDSGAFGNNAKTFAGGGLTFNNISITGGGTSANTWTFTGSNTFNTFTISAPKYVIFTAGTTTTVSSFVANGTSSNAITIYSSAAGSAATLSDTAGENTVKFCSIKDSTASGGALWTAKASTNVSGNTGWRFQKPTILVQ